LNLDAQTIFTALQAREPTDDIEYAMRYQEAELRVLCCVIEELEMLRDIGSQGTG
jgi:hypothetical protein